MDETLADQSGKQQHLLRKMEEKEVDISQIGLADAIIYQTTLNLKDKLVTGDNRFKSIPFVVYLKDEKQLTNELEEIT